MLIRKSDHNLEYVIANSKNNIKGIFYKNANKKIENNLNKYF